MALTRTTADAILKEDYQPAIREQLSNINVLLSQLEQSDKDVEGRRAVLSLHVGRNQGTGARAESETLPDAGNQAYAEERVTLKYNYGRIEISGPVMKSTKSDKGSFARAVQSEVKGMVDDLKRDVNRQVWGTSNGVIATAGTTTAANVVVLAAATSLTQMRQFEIGMKVDIGTVASPTTVASNRTITAVNRAAKTITVDGAVVTTSSSHFVFRAGAGGVSPQREVTGIQTIVDSTGTLFNVDPAVHPVWASYVNGNSGTPRTATDTLFETAMDEIVIEGGSRPDLLLTTAGVARAFANGLKDQKRFQNTTELKGGFSAVSVATTSGELNLAWDRDAPAGKAFLLSTDHLQHHIMSDWEWMDDDGSVLNRVPNKDAYEATLYKYSELSTDKRNSHGRIDDLIEA